MPFAFCMNMGIICPFPVLKPGLYTLLPSSTVRDAVSSKIGFYYRFPGPALACVEWIGSGFRENARFLAPNFKLAEP